MERTFPLGLPAVVACMLLWVLFQMAAYGERPQWLSGLPLLDVPHYLTFSGATALLLLFVGVRGKSLRPLGFRSEGLGTDLRWLLVASLAMAGLYLILAALGYLALLVFAEDASSAFKAQLHDSFFKDESLGALLRVVLLYPILEEVWYRGLLYTPIRRERGRIAAILLTALIFAFAHGNKYPVNQFLGGLIFAFAYESRRGLVAPILLHMAGNGALALLGWSVRHWQLLS